MTSGVLYFNASIVNSGGVAINEDALNQQLSFNRTFNANILNRQDDYEMSIIRMVLPSDGIDLMNITAENQADYKVGLSYRDYHSYCLLPQLKSVSELAGGDVPYSYKSQLDVVEAVNRSFTHCFNMFMQQQLPLSAVYPQNATLTTTAVNNFTPIRLAGLNVTIGGLTLTSALPSHVSIIVKTSSKECLLWAGNTNDPEFAYLTNASQPITFSDSALLPFNRCIDTKGVYKFQPYESLLNLSTELCTTMQIIIKSKDISLTGSFKYGYTCGCIVDDSFPSIAPTYNIDTKGMLTLQLQQAYIYRNIRVELSPKLFRLLTFGAQSRRWIPEESVYQLIYPSLLLTHPLEDNLQQILTIEQFQSTKYRFNHITNILVVARNLDVQGEFYNDYIRDNTVQDFALETSVDMENLIFTTDGGLVPLRRYKMNASTPLTHLMFDIRAQYSDGSTRVIYLKPGSAFQCKIAFFPI